MTSSRNGVPMAVEGCYSKVGDVITVPAQFQILKIYAKEDTIYYLCAAVDNPKKMVSLHDGHVMLNTEYDRAETMIDMDFEMLDAATAFIEKNYSDEGPKGDEGPDETTGGDE